MVVATDRFAKAATSRHLMQCMGVPHGVLRQTEMAHPDLDWRSLVAALDCVFVARGGGAAQSWFWRQRYPELEGMTPIEALPGTHGPERVRQAAVGFAFAEG